MKQIVYGLCAVTMVLCLGCNRDQEQKARERAADAKQETRRATERARQELHRLAQKAKRQARELHQSVHQSLQGGDSTDESTAGAERKLHDAGEKVRAAGEQAAVKLDRAALVAKVKAKLAADVGLSAATSVDVDTSGQVITLRGTVSSESQKQEAEQAAGQVSGVTKVVNLLQVKP
jgi:osmotically-inducible protein OsmY